MALEGDETAVTPRDEICDVKVIITDLNADIRVRRESGNLLQQLVSHPAT